MASPNLPEHIREILPLPAPAEIATLEPLAEQYRRLEGHLESVNTALQQTRTYADKLRALEAKTAAMRHLLEHDDQLEQTATKLAAARRPPRRCRSLLVKINEHYLDERRNQLFAVTDRRMILLGQSRSLTECQAGQRWWQERLDEESVETEQLGVIAM